MALRTIVQDGDPILKKVCRPVTKFDDRLGTLLDDMKETLLDSGGVGLAAPQVGILRRVCVMQNEDDEVIELINPEIIYTEGEQTGLEGCLSVPGKYGIVTRPEVVRVRAQDRNGDFFEVEDSDLTARCFCHEIEHLDGHLFVEHTDHLMTEEELEEFIRRQRKKRIPDAYFVYGNAGFRRSVAAAAGGGRARCLRRVHPAGQAQESGHENDVFSCEGVCLDTGLGSLSAG